MVLASFLHLGNDLCTAVELHITSLSIMIVRHKSSSFLKEKYLHVTLWIAYIRSNLHMLSSSNCFLSLIVPDVMFDSYNVGRFYCETMTVTLIYLESTTKVWYLQ